MRTPVLGLVIIVIAAAAARSAQAQDPAQLLGIPKTVTLEGMPTVKVETSEDGTARQQLNPQEAAQHPLRLRFKDGTPFGQGNDPLQIRVSDGFTYVTTKPGSYIRLRRLNDRITYVEHLDQGPKSVTYWGEIRLGLGK